MLACVQEKDCESAERTRRRLSDGGMSPAAFRAALEGVAAPERDAWVDRVFGLEDLTAEDGAELPRGGVPYLPCSVDALLRMVDLAQVQASDVLVDIGSGAGRAAVLVHLLTGARAIGVEIQPSLVAAARDLAERVNAPHVSWVQGDAALLTGSIASGSVFFLYCPFSGARLEKVLGDLEPLARTRQIRVCAVDLPLPHRPWLTPVSPPSGDLAVYRSTLVDPPACASIPALTREGGRCRSKTSTGTA
jgi:SAM-dependent methyltransferase